MLIHFLLVSRIKSYIDKKYIRFYRVEYPVGHSIGLSILELSSSQGLFLLVVYLCSTCTSKDRAGVLSLLVLGPYNPYLLVPRITFIPRIKNQRV